MKYTLVLLAISALVFSCDSKKPASEKENTAEADARQDSLAGYGVHIDTARLPAPYATESHSNEGKSIGWPEGKTPTAPKGFKVTKFAGGLEHPRWIYAPPSGDIFVAESDDAKKSADRITIFRDSDGDGQPDMSHSFIENGLNQPFGMLILNGYFYVANVDALIRYPYEMGQDKITTGPEKILDLPAGGYNHHWTRNIVVSPDSSKIYVSVGSSSNVGEHGMDKEKRRANILVIDPDGKSEEIYASGLRNPVGMDWNPANDELWAAVNERDELGDNLVPDYVTSVQKGAFYGWPYAYFGPNKDPKMADKAPGKVKQTIVPDVAVGAHTASLGFTFYDKEAFPRKYQNGAFVGQHGSWNRAELNGYRVLFIPFKNGKPSGGPEDFLTGFIADQDSHKVYGRPVCVTVDNEGALLVADDGGNTIWKVSAI